MDTIIHDKSSNSYVNHIYKTFFIPLIKVYTVTGGISTSFQKAQFFSNFLNIIW